MSIEVEQKFNLMGREGKAIEKKLEDLGFSKRQLIEFVDWYYDVDTYDLTQQDCWLRYRERSGNGMWQLKRGNALHRTSSGSTAYEEFEGEAALEIATSLIPATANRMPSFRFVYEEALEPTVPLLDAGLMPFARIHTSRSSWQAETAENPSYQGVVVDLDSTDYGYTVGEVEVLVHDSSEIEAARARIRDLVQKLNDGPNGQEQAVAGKVEFYLQRFRPELYDKLLTLGLMG